MINFKIVKTLDSVGAAIKMEREMPLTVEDMKLIIDCVERYCGRYTHPISYSEAERILKELKDLL